MYLLGKFMMKNQVTEKKILLKKLNNAKTTSKASPLSIMV